MRSDRILHDFIRRLGASQEELARTKARLAQVERGSHPGAETETLRDQLREARVELQIAQGQRDGAQLSVAKMAGELTEERRACEVATRSAEIFRTEVTDLRRQLDARSDALETSHRQLTSSEAARVRAERERDSLAEENARLSSQLAEAERRASDLQDDYDIGTEEARRAGAVECRDATATENEARGVTFDFFDTLFPLLDEGAP